MLEPFISHFWSNLFFLISRYLHIVCTTLLVGGTLFYEMVVPIAIDELKSPQQLSVFGRARWVFRWIVWLSAGLLIFSGIVSAYRHARIYETDGAAIVNQAQNQPPPSSARVRLAMQSGWWMAAHAGAGLIAVIVALFLTLGRRPPEHPVRWMRMNLVILLVVIFLGSATRHVRLLITESAAKVGMKQIQSNLP